MKVCKVCGIEKSYEYFYKEKKNKDGLSSACKTCVDIRNQEWKKANIEKYNDCYKRFRENNYEKLKNYQNKWRSLNRNRSREIVSNAQKKARYNLSDYYIKKNLIYQDRIDKKLLEDHPEIIEIKRLIIQNKRTIKSITNAN